MTECGSQSSVETRQIILTGQIKVETPRNLSVFVGLLLLVQGGETIKGRPVASVCRRGLIPHVLPASAAGQPPGIVLQRLRCPVAPACWAPLKPVVQFKIQPASTGAQMMF